MSRSQNHKKWDKYKRFEVVTFYFGESIDLKKVQENVRQYTYLTRDFPLVIKLLESQYAVVTKFGAVSFWNVPENLRRQVIDELRPFIKSAKPDYHYSDTVRVFVGADADRFTFEEVYLHDLDVKKIQIISYVSCQSVALERYEDEIENRLSGLGHVIEDLKAGKWSKFVQKHILSQIGNVLAIKQSAIAHLALFDKPDMTWEREEIETLYGKMNAEYELQDRFDILNEKMDFLTENNQTLLDFISWRQGHRLEWVVVILIAIEILLFVFELWHL